MIIETERLVLREWQLTDVSDIVEGLNDFDTAKNLTVPFPYKKEHAESFVNNHLKNDKKTNPIVFLDSKIILKYYLYYLYPYLNKQDS